METELYKRVKELARKERRSMSQMIQILVERGDVDEERGR